MSASREKKQRLDGVADLTPKQRRDLKEAQRAKRNKIGYTITGVLAVVLVAALLIWDSGLFRGDPVAATVNDQEYTASQVAYYHGTARQNLINYAQYGILPYDSAKKAADQVVDESTASTLSAFLGISATVGDTYETIIQDMALQSLQQVTLLCDQAAAEGYTLSEDGQKALENNIKQYEIYAAQSNLSYKTFLTATFGKIMTPKAMESELARIALATDFQAHKTESYTYTDAELETYYQENAGTMDTYEYRFAEISGATAAQTDADGNPVTPTEAETAAAMSAAKVKAEAMAQELKTGSDFSQIAVKYVSEEEGAQFTADPDYNYRAAELGSTSVSYSYGQWLTSSDEVRKAGDIGVVEDQTNQRYFVVQLINRWRAEDTRATVDARHILVKAALDEGATAPTEAQYEAAKAQIEEYKAQWEAGDKTAEAFGKLADAHSEDPGSNNGGLYQGVTPGTMFTGFNDFLFAPGRQVGDVGVVQNTQEGQQGYHLIYIDALGDIAWKGTARTALQSVAYTEWYDGVNEGYTSSIVAAGMDTLAR